jgi:hypothetical protein
LSFGKLKDSILGLFTSHLGWLLLGKYQATDSQGRYLHWNDFQWRVEKGDPPLAAWVATNLARKAITKNLPLLQADGDRG